MVRRRPCAHRGSPGRGSSPRPCGSSGRCRCARPRRSHGRGGEPVPAALLVRTAAPGAPPGSRDRHLTREIVPPADVLAGRPTISRTRPERGGMGRGRARAHDDSRADPGLARAGPRPAETGAGLRNSMSPRRDPGAGTGTGPGSACAMRAQRDTVHPGSHHASPARRNPSSLDSREPTWRNASPGDITRTTPSGRGRAGRRSRSHGRSHTTPPGRGRAGRWCRRQRRSHRSRRRVAPGAARTPPRRRSAGAPAAPPDRSPEEP